MEASDNNSEIWVSYPRASYGARGPAGRRVRVLIVDDHPAYRRSLRHTFDMEPDIEVVGEAVSGEQAIQEAGRLKPDLVLMDISMPSMTGMDATRTLVDNYPGILVVVLTMYKGREHLREARRAGASAYVMKDAGADVLLQTIHDVMLGENPLLKGDDQPAESPPAVPAATSPGAEAGVEGPFITSNERAILRLLAEGLDNRQIAERLGVPESMVRTYLAEIDRKMGRKKK